MDKVLIKNIRENAYKRRTFKTVLIKITEKVLLGKARITTWGSFFITN